MKALYLVVLAALLSGCGNQIDDLCERSCECEGCDAEECKEQAKELEELADAFGCGGAYDAFIDCVDDTAECVDGDFQPDDSCQDELDACE
jgi:hypothetical protein